MIRRVAGPAGTQGVLYGDIDRRIVEDPAPWSKPLSRICAQCGCDGRKKSPGGPGLLLVSKLLIRKELLTGGWGSIEKSPPSRMVTTFSENQRAEFLQKFLQLSSAPHRNHTQ